MNITLEQLVAVITPELEKIELLDTSRSHLRQLRAKRVARAILRIITGDNTPTVDDIADFGTLPIVNRIEDCHVILQSDMKMEDVTEAHKQNLENMRVSLGYTVDDRGLITGISITEPLGSQISLVAERLIFVDETGQERDLIETLLKQVPESYGVELGYYPENMVSDGGPKGYFARVSIHCDGDGPRWETVDQFEGSSLNEALKKAVENVMIDLKKPSL